MGKQEEGKIGDEVGRTGYGTDGQLLLNTLG